MPKAVRRASTFFKRTTPQSYPALGHLCASVAQESAFSKPLVKCAYFGEMRAQRPNAPSTWTQAARCLGPRGWRIWSLGAHFTEVRTLNKRLRERRFLGDRCAQVAQRRI